MNLYGFVYNSPIEWIDILGNALSRAGTMTGFPTNIDATPGEKTGFHPDYPQRREKGKFLPNPKPENISKSTNTGNGKGPLVPKFKPTPQGTPSRGSGAEVPMQILDSPIGSTWKRQMASKEALKICKEIAGRNSGSNKCGCCEATIGWYEHYVAGGKLSYAWVKATIYWPGSSCSEAQKKRGDFGRNPKPWGLRGFGRWKPKESVRESREKHQTEVSTYFEYIYINGNN
jgi:hypothetical protein